MTPTRLRLAAASLPLAAVAAVLPLSAAHAATTQSVAYAGPGTVTPLLAGTSEVATYVPDDSVAGRGVATATIRVTYHNFSAAAKASFQRAVNTWAATVTTSVPITIDATYKPLDPNVLGSAGSSAYYLLTKGTQHVLAGKALANKLVGKNIDTSKPDIVANFSSSFDNWYFGTGQAPKGKYDFQSVVTHEIGHGLGFLGSGYVTSGKGQLGDGAGHFFAYDENVKNGNGAAITSFPNNSAALKTQLTSGNLFLTAPKVVAANGGKKAKIFAPATFQPGSSYSHLDENTFKAGNVNSLMTPVLGDGETIRSPGPIVKALFATIGW